MREMPVSTIEMIGQVRAALAAFLPSGTKHQMINNQLTAAIEQIRQRFLSIWSVEHIFFVDLDPGQLTTRRTERVTLTSKLFLPHEQVLPNDEPFSFRSDFWAIDLPFRLFHF